MMFRNLFLISAVVCILSSCAFASLPDAGVEPGRLAVSGLSARVIQYPSGEPLQFEWISLETDYGINKTISVGMGYWKTNSLDELAKKDEGNFVERIVSSIFSMRDVKYTGAVDLHLLNQFSSEKEGAAMNAAWVFGIGAMETIEFDHDKVWQNLFPEIGFALSKKFFGDILTIRVNPVFGMPGGIEIGLKPLDNLEITYGNQGLVNCKLIF